MQIERFVFNPFMENTYVIYDEETKSGAVIDPGCSSEAENEILRSFIRRKGIKIDYLINTHCHIDHILGNAFVKSEYNAVFIAPKNDLFLLELMVEQAKNYRIDFTPSPKPDNFIFDNEKLTIGRSSAEFIFTPGHTPGEYCLYFEKEKICFTGDVLFKEGIGRTDLWGGDYDTLIDSIKNKLFILPEDVKILPGHDSDSTIGYEKRFNPFFNEL